MVPPSLLPLFRACRDAGGRALLVGGTVRDALLGHPGKDLDIEVHGLPFDTVLRVLRRFGHVNEVGRAFGVLKLRIAGYDLDVSLPRRDQRQGTGHKGILATADPHLGVVDAARRRDLTINAIAWDPLAEVYEDPFDGRADLERRLLRAVDPATFGEDPLRALRVAQFAARFGFDVHPDLEALCAAMPLEELPAERIRGEVEKLLLKGRDIARGWDLARRTGMWARVIPEWTALPPHLERVARAPVADPNRRLAILYAAACEGLPPDATERVLDRLRVFKVGGYPVRRTVLSLLARLDRARGPLDDATVRRLGEDGEMELLSILADRPDLLAAAERLGVRTAPLPPLLDGATLAELGVQPGPEMGDILRRLRELQLEGAVADGDAARHLVRRWVEHGRFA